MMPKWETKRLGDVCEIVKGRKPTLKTTQSDGDMPYLVAKVMRGSQEAEYASVKDRNSITVSNEETIIICDGSNSGEVFTGFSGILSSTMGKIAKRTEIDDAYLRAFLNSTFEVFNGAKTGAAIPHLDKEAMFALEFPLPPIPEQQRIVGILDKTLDCIAVAKANAEKSLQNTKALFKGQLQSVFLECSARWTMKPLESVTEILNGYAFKSTDFSSSIGVKSIKITNVGVGHFVLEEGNHLPTNFTSTYSDVSAITGDVVLALTRTIIAEGLKVAIVPASYHGALLNQRVASIRCKSDSLTQSFLFAYLSTQAVFDYVKEHVNTLMQPNLSIMDLRALPIPLPPLDKQKQITSELALLHDETKRLGTIYQQKLDALDALKKSLLHQAFSGQL